MTFVFRTVLVGLSIVGCVAALSWAESEAPTPQLDPALAGHTQGLVLARCAVCHSTDLIEQQRLPHDKWQAIVDKMRHWGAQLTDEEGAEVVAYLSVRYSPTVPRSNPAESVAAAAAAPAVSDRPHGLPRRGATLFATKCQACHGPKAAGGAGPKLSGNPILREDDRFWETVTRGRGGMPPWGAVLKPQDIADIHAWLQLLAE